MALLDPYASLPDLRARLGANTGTLTTADDSILTTALLVASRTIEGPNGTGRQFNQDVGVTSRVYFPLSPTTVLIDDIATSAGLLVKVDQDDDGTFEDTWSATDYLLRPLNGIVNGVTGWPYTRIDGVGGKYFPVAGQGAYMGSISREYFNSTWPLTRKRPAVQVTATFGWPSVPSNIHEACLILAEELYKLKDAPFGVAGWQEYGAVRVKENPMLAYLLAGYSKSQVVFA
jgi:hypothetical protein